MRRRPAVLTAPAKADVKEIARWYKRQRSGLERRFRIALGATILSIGAHPETRQIIHAGEPRLTASLTASSTS